MSHGGVGTLPAPILIHPRGNQRHVTREKLGTLASEHGEECNQLIAKVARQSLPHQWGMKAKDQESAQSKLPTKGTRCPKFVDIYQWDNASTLPSQWGVSPGTRNDVSWERARGA